MTSKISSTINVALWLLALFCVLTVWAAAAGQGSNKMKNNSNQEEQNGETIRIVPNRELPRGRQPGGNVSSEAPRGPIVGRSERSSRSRHPGTPRKRRVRRGHRRH